MSSHHVSQFVLLQASGRFPALQGAALGCATIIALCECVRHVCRHRIAAVCDTVFCSLAHARVFIFGGCGEGGGASNDFFQLETDTWTWCITKHRTFTSEVSAIEH